MSLSAAQFRAARALLGWSQKEAAQRCGVGVITISRLELGEREPGERVLRDIVARFEQAGITFSGADGNVGVFLSTRINADH